MKCSNTFPSRNKNKFYTPGHSLLISIFALQIFAAPKRVYHKISIYAPPGVLYLEIALKYKVKQSKNGKFSSNYKASPIDFETQISLSIYVSPNISPSKNKLLKIGLWKI